MEIVNPTTEESLTVNHLSFSSLKEFRKSPRHFWDYRKKPYDPVDISDAALLGKAIDTLLLTPDRWDDTFIVYTKFPRRSNADKAKWQELVDTARKEKKHLIHTEMLAKAKEILEVVRLNKNVMAVVENLTKTQVKLRWKDKNTGLYMLGYADGESVWRGMQAVVELKTASNTDPQKWVRDTKYMDYPFQTGVYLTGYEKMKYQFPIFLYIVVDTTPPYGSYLVFAGQDWVDFGKSEVDGTLKAFNYCVENGYWNESWDFRLLHTREYFSTDIHRFYTRVFSDPDVLEPKN